MRVTVRWFAVLREHRRCESESVEVADGTTLEALYHSLVPIAIRPPVAFARNLEYARKTDLVVDGDEIAFIPPIGGG